MGQSVIDNLATQSTLCTRNRTKTNKTRNTTHEIINDEQHGHRNKKLGVNQCVREG